MVIRFTHRRWLGCVLFAITCVAIQRCAHAGDALAVHEWGTFTALQDDSGEALPGINIDDEPLPAFCHNLSPWAIRPSTSTRTNSVEAKGIPVRNPWVTLRLETPVLYFHPAAGAAPFSVDVDVRFRGGWLTEFYPHAQPDAPGLKRNGLDIGRITPQTVGSLAWRNVEVGIDSRGPDTPEHVWLAPRAVHSAPLTVPPQTKGDKGAESEQFLFYRGVGNRTAPLRVIASRVDRSFAVHAQCADVLAGGQSARVKALWLVHVRRDGGVAYRALDPVTLTSDARSTVATIDGTFAERDYSAGRLDDLRATIHRALVDDGLNDDEATAMLETWRRSYFQSPGLRLFFLVPRGWTDAVLPLTLSRPAEVTRVMMGRIELVSPEQRELLQRLAAMPPRFDTGWLNALGDSPAARRFREGRSDFGDLGVKIPASYQTYLDLGRFRNALVLAEQRVRPTPGLTEFIRSYGLDGDEPR